MSLTPKQQRFVDEYLVDLNAAAAARRAGYSPKRADALGHENLRKPEIAAAVQQAMKMRASRTEITADDVLREWAEIARASSTELVRYRVRACRHCHGIDHEYQWISEREWQKAVEAAQSRPAKEGEPHTIPSNAGGYGYSTTLKPVPGCFYCLGDGQTDVLIPDTATLSPGAAKLYAGVKQTKEGIEVKMRDQDGALLQVARHLGMFVEKVEVDAKVKGGVTYTAHMPVRGTE